MTSGDEAPQAGPLHPLYAHPCTRVVDPGGPVEHCGATPTRRYVNGWYCAGHAPAPPARRTAD